MFYLADYARPQQSFQSCIRHTCDGQIGVGIQNSTVKECHFASEVLLDNTFPFLITGGIGRIEWAKNARVGAIVILQSFLRLRIDKSKQIVRLKKGPQDI